MFNLKGLLVTILYGVLCLACLASAFYFAARNEPVLAIVLLACAASCGLSVVLYVVASRKRRSAEQASDEPQPS